MRDHSQDQVFTVFGGAYVAEHHGVSRLPRSESASRTSPKIAAVAAILMLGITTATAMKANRSPEGALAYRAGVNWVLAGIQDALY